MHWRKGIIWGKKDIIVFRKIFFWEMTIPEMVRRDSIVIMRAHGCFQCDKCAQNRLWFENFWFISSFEIYLHGCHGFELFLFKDVDFFFVCLYFCIHKKCVKFKLKGLYYKINNSKFGLADTSFIIKSLYWFPGFEELRSKQIAWTENKPFIYLCPVPQELILMRHNVSLVLPGKVTLYSIDLTTSAKWI